MYREGEGPDRGKLEERLAMRHIRSWTPYLQGNSELWEEGRVGGVRD